jgi:exoribonuclease R
MDEDIFIAQDDMNGAIHDDIVLVEITSKMNLDRLEGRILKVIERKNSRYIGRINFDSRGNGHITLDDSKIKLNIVVLPEDASPYIVLTLPNGRPPTPNATSKFKEPVETVSTF